MSWESSSSISRLSPLVVALVCSLLAWDNINTWAANRSRLLLSMIKIQLITEK